MEPTAASDLRVRAKALLDLGASLGGLALFSWLWLAGRRLRHVEMADPVTREMADWAWLAVVPGVVMVVNSLSGVRSAWRGARPGIADLAGTAIVVVGILLLAALLLTAGLDAPRGWEHTGIGTRLNDRGRHAEALPHFEKALGFLGEDGEALVGAGLACLHLGDLPRARGYLDRAVESEPGNPLALLGRARVRRLQGDLEGAREDFETSDLIAPRPWLDAPMLEEERKALAR